MIWVIAFALMFAVLHVIRGRGWLSRAIFFPLCFALPALFGFLLKLSYVDIAVVSVTFGIGIILWLATGWGLGLKAVNPVNPNDVEKLRNKDISHKVYAYLADIASGFKADNNTYKQGLDKLTYWCSWWMTFRGLQGAFIYLPLIYFAPISVLSVFACALQGAIYNISGKISREQGVAIAEVTDGFLKSFIFALTVYLSSTH